MAHLYSGPHAGDIENGEPGSFLFSLILLQIFRQCDTNALMLLEQTCQEWAPPRPRLSLVQEAVRDKMSRIRLPGTSLGCTMGLQSHPLLLQDKERLKKRVEDWCQDPQRASLHMLQDLNPENIITLASEDPVCRKQMMLDSVRKVLDCNDCISH